MIKVSPSLRLKELLGPVTRVKKRKKQGAPRPAPGRSRLVPTANVEGGLIWTWIQGYLAHKKAPTP